MTWTNVPGPLAARTLCASTTRAVSGVHVHRDSSATRSTLVKVCDDHTRLDHDNINLYIYIYMNITQRDNNINKYNLLIIIILTISNSAHLSTKYIYITIKILESGTTDIL